MPGERWEASKGCQLSYGGDMYRSRSTLTVHGNGHGDGDGQTDPYVSEIRHPALDAVQVQRLQHDGEDGAQRANNGVLQDGDYRQAAGAFRCQLRFVFARVGA